MVVACDLWGILSSAGECVHAMDNTVHGCDFGLSEVLMTELHIVRDLYCACGFSHYVVVAVVLECHSHIPTRCAAKVPRFSCPCFSVCDDVAPKRPDGCSVIIECAMEV